MKELKKYVLISIVGIIFFSACKKKEQYVIRTVTDKTPSLFNEDIRSLYFQSLDSAAYYIQKIDTSKSLIHNKNNFLKSREWYKRVEPMLLAYDYENYISMNAPNLLKVEAENYAKVKKVKPRSYQVLEEILYGEEPLDSITLHLTLTYLKARIPYIRKNHVIIKQNDRHHLKMLRDAIINIAAKGITGFDSPKLANSLQEAVFSYQSIIRVLEIYKETFTENTLYKEFLEELQLTINTLEKGDFDNFDRYAFIKNHTNKQLEFINAIQEYWNIPLSKSRQLNPKAANLFSKDFYNIKKFAPPHTPVMNDERIALGQKLFNDKSLSKEGQISCATCHIKEKAFTDGFKKAKGLAGIALDRNTIALPYAVYQKAMFYDGRADGLEDQIVKVVTNENEFHLDMNTIQDRINNNKEYVKDFKLAYDGKISNLNIRRAIATYIRSLAPFDSKFDRNMQGLENTLTAEERLGFNLFMGKAACATCHFPPAFNGTVPPKFLETEFENLGVTQNVDFDKPILDKDPGRYFPYKVEEKRGFFKTVTLRNIALTAPYMHNGAFESLEEVVTFYNNGGGQGMGLTVPHQTLPKDSLNLSKKEVNALITFMNTLTDKEYEKNIN